MSLELLQPACPQEDRVCPRTDPMHVGKPSSEVGSGKPGPADISEPLQQVKP